MMAGRRVLAAVILVLAIGAAWAWFELYFRWRHCFNDEGRCFDEASGTVYHAQSGLPLGILAACLFAASVLVLARSK